MDSIRACSPDRARLPDATRSNSEATPRLEQKGFSRWRDRTSFTRLLAMTKLLKKALFALSLIALVPAGVTHADDFETSAIGAIRGCDGAQTDALKQIEADVAARLAFLVTDIPRYDLAYVRDNFVKPTNRPWNEGSPSHAKYERYLRSIAQVFEKMRGVSQSGLTLECKNSVLERNCRGGEVFAYVLFTFGQPIKRLHLCTDYFKLSPNQQRATFLHELSHYAASTDDLALDWMNGAQTDISRASQDAYHVEQFMSGDVPSTLKRQIWFWNWPKK
jgi:hypothetical protein